ncbi:MAG: MBL fold metallo-hydrolase [Synergistaceae bacterium]|jgi:glyoxylase-like metal-dependent hydrolase (beta-lactamase superfamily II)|nr:MBL fold metallo-hydrolase [Synergistaceae bacterium]
MKFSGVFMWCAVAIILFSMNTQAFAADIPNVYKYQLGAFEVILLSEGQSQGSGGTLIGTDDEMMKKYMPSGTYPTAVNTFLVRTPDRVVLIDTGFGRELFKNMKSVGVEPELIDAVLLTHMHGDHIGGLLTEENKLAFPNAKLYLARQERDYWASEEIMKTFPEDRQGGFQNSQKALTAYGNAVQTFDPRGIDVEPEFLLPGIKTIAAFGHTPGHTLYMIESDGVRLLIWGDLTHAMAIQMPVPQVAMTYDVNPEEAVASRLTVLKYVSEEKIPVAGMHVPYPGVGEITPNPESGYTFTASAP